MRFIGADGCRGGWAVAVLSDQGERDFRILPDLDSLWREFREASLILVDIPVGLPDGGPEPRACDAEARAAVGFPRSSSVFPVPCRKVVELAARELARPARRSREAYARARKLSLKLTGKGVSKQAWNIVPKILEADGLLRERLEARETVRESHPEVCFWALKGRRRLGFGKATGQGAAERLRILEEYIPDVRARAENALRELRGEGASRADLLDALALALTAMKGRLGATLRTFPLHPPRDSRGLPMEIVYSWQ